MTMKRYNHRYWMLAGLALCYMMANFHRPVGAAIAGDLVRAFGIDPVSLGLLTSLYFYPYGLVQVPIGVMADRLGARATIAMFVGAMAAGTLLFGLASGYGLVLAGRALVGMGAGGVWVPAARALGAWSRKGEFSRFVGILLALGQIGAIAGSGALAAVSLAVGWRPAFVALGLFMLAVTAFSLAVVRNRPGDLGLPALVAEADPRSVSVGRAIRLALGRRDFRLITAAYFCIGAAWLGFQGLWGGPFLTDAYGLSKAAAGGVLTMIPLGMLIGCPVAGWLSGGSLLPGRPGRALLVGGVALSVGLWVLLTLGPLAAPAGAMYPVLFAFGLAMGTFTVVSYALVAELVPPEVAGTALGLFNVSAFVGGGLFQQVMGLIVGAFPRAAGGAYPAEAYRAAFALCLAAAVATLACVLALKEERLEVSR